MDDLFKALQMLQAGVKEAQFRGALSQAQEQVQQVKASVTNEQEQRTALHQISQGLVAQMAGLGVPATTIQQVAGAVGPSVDPLTAQEMSWKREDQQGAKRFAQQSALLDKQLGASRDEAMLKVMADRAASADGSKATADQFKVAGFGRALLDSEGTFRTLESKAFDRSSAGNAIASLGPNRLKSGDLQRQEQAERSFINAYLRRVSGAAISKEEFSSAELQYFPRSGDTAETIEQKRRNRLGVIESFKAEGGGAWNRIVRQEPEWLTGSGPQPASAPAAAPMGTNKYFTPKR